MNIAKKLARNTRSLHKSFPDLSIDPTTVVIKFSGNSDLSDTLDQINKKVNTQTFELVKPSVNQSDIIEKSEWKYCIIRTEYPYTNQWHWFKKYGITIQDLIPVCYDAKEKLYIYYAPDLITVETENELPPEYKIVYNYNGVLVIESNENLFQDIEQLKQKGFYATPMELLFGQLA